MLGEDLTIADRATGRAVVEGVIDIIHQTCIFADDKQMLRRLAYVGSEDGTAPHTFLHEGVDYYGGIWQVGCYLGWVGLKGNLQFSLGHFVIQTTPNM